MLYLSSMYVYASCTDLPSQVSPRYKFAQLHTQVSLLRIPPFRHVRAQAKTVRNEARHFRYTAEIWFRNFKIQLL